MQRTGTVIAGLLLAGALGSGAAQAQSASAEMMDADGEAIGSATLSELAQGVHLVVEVEGLPEGVHALHIHETGECETPDFESAGGHFNPDDSQHGWDSEQGPHAGDLPNVHVQDDGVLAVEVFTDKVTLGEGDTSLFDDDGSAVVVHEGEDDHMTDPTGDAGSRLACGVIEEE